MIEYSNMLSILRENDNEKDYFLKVYTESFLVAQ